MQGLEASAGWFFIVAQLFWDKLDFDYLLYDLIIFILEMDFYKTLHRKKLIPQ